MKKLLTSTSGGVRQGTDKPPFDISAEPQYEDCPKESDTEALAREVTDPILESIKQDLDKLDVSRFKK